jgi:hypothetical protein
MKQSSMFDEAAGSPLFSVPDTPPVEPAFQTPKETLDKVWKRKPKDYKGITNGKRSIMILRDGATRIVPLDELTPEEIERELKYI